MSALCVWKDRQQDEYEIIHQLATMYPLDCDLCWTQYDLLHNDSLLKGADVKSLPLLVAHFHINQLHKSYKYHLPAVMHPANIPGEQCQFWEGIQ